MPDPKQNNPVPDYIEKGERGQLGPRLEQSAESKPTEQAATSSPEPTEKKD